jgi:transposase
MRKTKEICRLADARLSGRAIARAVGASNSTVSDVLSRLAAAELAWSCVEAMSETELEERLYRGQGNTAPDPREPDWDYVRKELGREHVTLQLLWREYKRCHPDGYQYSWFCERYRAWRTTADPVMRIEHIYGEKAFVDWAGDTVDVIDADTGEPYGAHLFVAVLGGSNLIFVEAFRCENSEAFLTGHAHAFAFFGGVPALVICDNLKTGVTRSDRYDPDINRDYAALAAHYGTAIHPARVRKPKDKSKVEGGVLVTYREVLAPLRNRTFFSLAELNEAIAEMLEDVNDRPFQKLAGSRRSVFLEHELACLRPLPEHAYHYRTRRSAKVHIDYHVEVARHRYSVPHTLISERVDVVFDERTFEVYHKGERVAAHVRSHVKGGMTTDPAHRPPSHRDYAGWSPERMEKWAACTGEACGRLARAIMDSRPHPEMGYRNCLGLLALEGKYGRARLEAACARALASGANRYQSVKTILERGLDSVPLPAPAPPPAVSDHDNVRGPDYYA